MNDLSSICRYPDSSEIWLVAFSDKLPVSISGSSSRLWISVQQLARCPSNSV